MFAKSKPSCRSTLRRGSFRLRLETLDNRWLPSTLAFSESLAGPAIGVAVNAAGDTYATTDVGSTREVYEYDSSGNVLHSNTNVGAAGGSAIALDSAGNVYMERSGNIVELDPTLQTVLFTETLPGAKSLFYGGEGTPGGTSGYGTIAVAGGDIYVAGAAGTGLPTTAGAFQTAYQGSSSRSNAYLAVIDPGSPAAYHLVYASYLGGNTTSNADAASGIAIDASGDVYITGNTGSTNFPTTVGAFQSTYGGGYSDTFVAKINPAASGAASLIYSTYLGGNGDDGWVSNEYKVISVADNSPSIAIDSSGNAYVSGGTLSTNFPTTAGSFQPVYGGTASNTSGTPIYGGDAFVAKINTTGSGLVYSTYLGGAGVDDGTQIVVDAAGDAFATGWTRSTNFPVTPDAVQPQKTPGNGGGVVVEPNSDAFVTELNPAGNGLVYSTYLGTASDDFGFSIAIDPTGDILLGTVVGRTDASGFLNEIVNAPPGPSLSVTGPSGLIAGTQGTFTISAVNPDGSADTDYSGTVQISSSDPKAILPGYVAISGGVGSFPATLETAGVESIAATDVSNSRMTGSDGGIAVTPAAASQMIFSQLPPSGTAGQTLGAVAVEIEDAFGNVEIGDSSDTVTLGIATGPSSQLNGALTETVAAGVATFNNLVFDTSGSYSLAATANLAGSDTLGPIDSAGIAIASPVSLKFGSITYNSRTKLYSETVTVTNITSGTLTGRMALELIDLPGNVALTDATGTTNGNPYIDFLTAGKTLKKNASVSITLTFTAPSAGSITFGTAVVVGL